MTRHLLSEAFQALRHYRLRSALTMLSIVWGVAALLLLLSYGRGFSEMMIRAWDQTGKDLIVIFNGQTSLQAGGERSGRIIRLEIEDVKALAEAIPAIEAISPEARLWLSVGFQHRLRNYSVDGVYAAFAGIRSMDTETGHFFSEEDVQQRRRVAVIGATVQRELFSEQPALGRDLRINGVRFQVIGVLKKKTQVTNYAMPDDLSVFVPYTTLSTLGDTRYLNDLVIRPVSNRFRSRLLADLRSTLANLHHFNVRDERAVEIRDWNEFRALVTNLAVGLNFLLTVIGTLTLSIGAVGVMNIMFVSVAERTREIGVLKAIGARRAHILGQFLFEALMITGTGGLVGYLLALLLVKLIGTLPALGPLFEDTSGRGDIHLAMSVSAVFVSTLLLAAVGVVAGLVPALRAARLDPAQAIRSE
jgi:putative ABC transport system permease protein